MEENILSGLVRVGIVSAVDTANRKARVIFEDMDNMTSGWLSVLQHYQTNIYVSADGEHTHQITGAYSGGGEVSTEPDHNHEGTYLTYWMPKINESVLVLYLPVFNSDGFILGGI